MKYNICLHMIQMKEANNQKGVQKEQKHIQHLDQSQNDKEQYKEKVVKKQTSSKAVSLINNIFNGPKSLIAQKPKHNPLLDDFNEEQEQLENEKQILKQYLQIKQQSLQENISLQKKTDQANQSVFSLPPDIKQEALQWIVQQPVKIQEVFDEIKPQITVHIIDSVQKGNPLSKYILYTIQGEDMHGRFLVKRKFTEFSALKKILFHRWPGSFIPGLKSKIEMKNQTEKQLSMRKILVNFLVSLSYSKHIYYKEEVQLFLRSGDIDICEMFNFMPELKLTDLVSRFQYAFGQDIQKLQGPKITQILSNFHKKLRKMIMRLEQMSAKALQLADSYDIYIKNLIKIGQTLRLYEHFSLAQFTTNNRQMTIFVRDEQKRMEKLIDIYEINPFYELFNLLEIQLIDAKSFLETLIAIDLFTLRKQEIQKQIIQSEGQKQQIQFGNNTIKTMTTRKHKQEVVKIVEQKLIKLKKQKEQTQSVYNIVQNVTVNHILPIFKAIKKNNYRLVLVKWIQLIGNQIPEIQEIWKFINTDTTQMLKKVSPFI